MTMDNNKAQKNIGIASNVIAGQQIADKVSDEIRFHASGGTGFAAEQANNLYDNLTLTPAKIVGDNNVKNGADRQIWFTPVQSKYYSTARETVNAAFENGGAGEYRYITECGRIMDLEVPKDQYESAIEIMREKIAAGQVADVTDPARADEIVRAGHYTYKQAKNIAEAGNIDSITYDAMDGAVVGLTVFSISSVISFGLMVMRGVDANEAAKIALKGGARVGGIAIASTVIAGQVSKACSTELINAVGEGTIAMGATLLVLSAVDVVKVFNGQISAERAARNLGCNTVGLFAGKEGYELGAAFGTAICPGFGTFIGGIVGAYFCGSVARAVTETLLDSFFGNADDKIRKIFAGELNRAAKEYILTKEELNTMCSSLVKAIDENVLNRLSKDSKAREKIACFVDDLAKVVMKYRGHVKTYELICEC